MRNLSGVTVPSRFRQRVAGATPPRLKAENGARVMMAESRETAYGAFVFVLRAGMIRVTMRAADLLDSNDRPWFAAEICWRISRTVIRAVMSRVIDDRDHHRDMRGCHHANESMSKSVSDPSSDLWRCSSPRLLSALCSLLPSSAPARSASRL